MLEMLTQNTWKGVYDYHDDDDGDDNDGSASGDADGIDELGC